MHYQEALDYCLAKSGAQPDEPWEGDVVVKVGEKIFAFFGVIENNTVGLKCGKDADEAHGWRAQYPDDVTVMPYLGRYGWNTFVLDGNIPDEELLEAIDTSYIDVLNRLPKGRREQINPHKSG